MWLPQEGADVSHEQDKPQHIHIYCKQHDAAVIQESNQTESFLSARPKEPNKQLITEAV